MLPNRTPESRFVRPNVHLAAVASDASREHAHARRIAMVRDAAVSFVRGTTFGWGRRELAAWLVSQYAPCLVADVSHFRSQEAPASRGATPARPVAEDDVERVVLEARSATLRLLSDLAWPSQARSIARDALARGAILELQSALGARLWVPVATTRMRLEDRVAALFVADSLNAPRSYANVALCRDCGELGFTSPIEHSAWCERSLRVA